MSVKPEHVVIAGAGIVGVSTAYFLAKEVSKITLVDPTDSVAPGASGKGAGFLALDWRDGTSVEKLSRRSFHLHQELADSFGADKIQYRRVTSCAFVDLSKSTNKKRRISEAQKEGLEWVNIKKAKSVKLAGDEASLAQVHPKMLCEAIWEATKKLTKCELVKGKVVSVEHSDGKFVGAKLESNELLEGDALLVAAGPWSADIVTGSKANSVLFSTKEVGNQVVFFTKGQNNFEGFVRPDKTMFCSGFCEDDVHVTEKPGQEEPTQEIAEQIVQGIKEAASSDFVLETDMVRACYQPSTPDGLPMIGRVPGFSGVYIAISESCWGILMGPATGEAMSHLILSGKTNNDHVDLKPFDPSRFGSFKIFDR